MLLVRCVIYCSVHYLRLFFTLSIDCLLKTAFTVWYIYMIMICYLLFCTLLQGDIVVEQLGEEIDWGDVEAEITVEDSHLTSSSGIVGNILPVVPMVTGLVCCLCTQCDM